MLFLKGGIILFLLINFFCKTVSADNQTIEILPPESVLAHHSLENLPKPFWPFSLEDLYPNNQAPNIPSGVDDICRYPAFAFYKALDNQLELPNFKQCPELKEYLDKVPVQQISLVYASENLMSPSSMMGHVFLKLTGTDSNSVLREHAVSFYTELEGINIPRLFIETMVRGKQGIFGLSPYAKFIEHYVGNEKRNLWEYEIEMNTTQRKLVQLHLWELKQSNLPYFFDRYNCATLISHVLRVARPEIEILNPGKVSPVDVVKSVEFANVIAAKRVILTSEWRVRMLSDSLSPKWTRRVQQSKDLLGYFESDTVRFLYSELGLAYTKYQLDEGNISVAESTKSIDRYRELQKDLGHLHVDLSDYKSPEKLSNDTQWFTGYLRREEQSLWKLGYLPAGLRREDDSRQYFGNNELRLMEGSILVDLEKEKFDIDELVLYSVSSLKPYSALTGGWSGKFELIVEDHFDSNVHRQKAFDIEGGLGLSKSIVKDMLIFALPTIGAGLSRGAFYFHSAAEIGFQIDAVFSSKVSGSYSRKWGQVDQSNYFDVAELSFSKFVTQNWTVSISWEQTRRKSLSLSEYALMLKYLY